MDLEAELRKSMDENELESQVAQKIKSFHGFLTREVAIRLIAKEKGLLKVEEKICQLASVPKGERKLSFEGYVRKIWPMASYSSGKRSRVIEIEDSSGGKPLVLWNDDVELARSLRLKDRIRVRGAYEKNGELHLGYSGSMEITEKAGFSDLSSVPEGEVVHLRGYISTVEGEDSFIRDGRTSRGFSFILSDGKSERRCVIFEGLDRSGRLAPADEVVIEGANVRNGNVEISSGTRLLSRRSKDMLLGRIKSIECNDERLGIDVEGRQVDLDRENALRLMHVSVAPDIALSTVVGLKKQVLLNSRIAVKIEQKDGQIIVRC